MAAANEAMARAAEAQRAGQWTVAEHHFREVLAAEPQRAEAHYHLAMVLAEQRRFDEALGSFDAAWQFRASVGAARADLQRALASNYVAVGMAFERASRLDRAAECFRKALELEPKDLAAAGNLGNGAQEPGPARRRGRLLSPRAGHRSALCPGPQRPGVDRRRPGAHRRGRRPFPPGAGDRRTLCRGALESRFPVAETRQGGRGRSLLPPGRRAQTRLRGRTGRPGPARCASPASSTRPKPACARPWRRRRTWPRRTPP